MSSLMTTSLLFSTSPQNVFNQFLRNLAGCTFPSMIRETKKLTGSALDTIVYHHWTSIRGFIFLNIYTGSALYVFPKDITKRLIRLLITIICS